MATEKERLKDVRELLVSIKTGKVNENAAFDTQDDNIVYILNPVSKIKGVKGKKKTLSTDGFINLISLIGIIAILGIVVGIVISLL